MANGKKFINNADKCVDDSLLGLVSSRPNLALLQGRRVVLQSNPENVQGRVAIICGGGSGHEPSFGGYVGSGMLDAAVAGSVFTSPPVNDILAAIVALGRHKPSGILILILNYTGDRVNFGLALERAISMEGMSSDIDLVPMGEDCALQSADKTAGRRGLAGLVLMIKIAGSMANSGANLKEISSFLNGNCVPPNIGTIGLSLSPCTLPGRTEPSFTLEKDEMVLGLGIHGEAGIKRLKMSSAEDSVQEMLSHMTSPESETRMPIGEGDQVVVFLNNLGSISNIEMGILAKEVVGVLKNSYKVDIVRFYTGTFMTSLEMAGFSITVLKSTDEIVKHLDSSTDAFGWSGNSCAASKIGEPNFIPDPLKKEKGVEGPKGPLTSDLWKAATLKALDFACEALISCEGQLNKMDSGAGDGDCGTTLKHGAEDLLKRLKCRGFADHLGLLFKEVANIVENSMGGTSGALYSLFFEAAASNYQRESECTIHAVSRALDKGLRAVKRYGMAELGDRTMIDAIEPALTALKNGKDAKDPLKAFEDATVAAEEGAMATLKMKARAGRASYVDESELKHPDPGAHAIGIIFRALYQGVKITLDAKI